MKENYTPETDAAQIFLGFTPDEGDYFVPVKTAHKLERERDEAREKIELSREWSAAIADIADNLRSELATVTEQRDRLAEQIEANHKGTLMLERMVYQSREQRDRLADAIKRYIAQDYTLVALHRTLAAVKGGEPSNP